ncbi:MAG: helix-turn-helix domain-containing protein [Culicoidibacterales bacterium]
MIDTKNIGRGLSYYRNQKDIRQLSLATDITALRALQRIEKGETLPRLDTLCALADRLDTSIAEIVFFDEYALYYQLNPYKDNLFEYVSEKNVEILQKILAIIATIFELAPPFKMRQELTIYQLYIISSQKQIYSEYRDNDKFQQKLTSLLSEYQLNVPMLTADIAVVILFFTYQPQPLTHDFYYEQITASLQEQSYASVIYYMNIELIKLGEWEQLIEVTLPQITKLRANARILPLVFIYGQLSLAQYNVSDNRNAHYHYQLALLLLSTVNNPEVEQFFFDCVTSQLDEIVLKHRLE